MSTNDTNYSCYIKAKYLFNQSYGSILQHIKPPVINSLEAGHTLANQLLAKSNFMKAGVHRPTRLVKKDLDGSQEESSIILQAYNLRTRRSTQLQPM